MKRKLLIATVLLTGISGTATTAFSAPIVAGTDFENVPRGHWAYSSIGKLNSLLPLERQIPDFSQRLMTRYEFAIFCARTDEFFQENPELSNPTVKDILAVFDTEFDRELSRLGCREPLDCKALGHGKRHNTTPRLVVRPSILIRRGYTDEAFTNNVVTEAQRFLKGAN